MFKSPLNLEIKILNDYIIISTSVIILIITINIMLPNRDIMRIQNPRTIITILNVSTISSFYIG
jgi:hypothetical protein